MKISSSSLKFYKTAICFSSKTIINEQGRPIILFNLKNENIKFDLKFHKTAICFFFRIETITLAKNHQFFPI